MPPERWERIEQLYHDALEREAGGRAAFLAEACAGDEALHREVSSLISAHDQAGDFIEAPPDKIAQQILTAEWERSMAGRRLGRYQLLSLLGAGGMGKVWRAKDTLLNREVAVKILPGHLAQSAEALARFKAEARAVATLSHPNILSIYDFGTEQGMTFAVMELLAGETLRSRLARSALGWHKAVEYGVTLADGLAAAHAKGIIHRDLKPENIFLTENGQAKILDFGLARVKRVVSAQEVVSTSTMAVVSQPGTVLGTVGYMSPEQVCGEEADAPSDIFSFGCVLYEIVTGRRAFARATAPETMAAILKDDPPPLAEAGQNVPSALEQLIVRCLEKQAERRYQSASELAVDLRDCLSGSGKAKSQLAGFVAGFRRAAWVSALLLAALAAALWWQPWQKPEQSVQRLISTFPGEHSAASFSPDGSMIAFLMKDGAGVPQIWVKNVAQGDPIQVTFDPGGAGPPRWSPNNDQIIFGRGRSVWSVPPLGGPLRILIDSGVNPSFSWDGSQIVFEKTGEMWAADSQRALEIWTANSDGSNQRKVEGVAPSTVTTLNPTFSPDGFLIAYCSANGPTGDIWVIPSKGGQPRQLTFDRTSAGKPVWRPDGRHIIFSSGRRGSRTLWRVPINGGEPQPVLVSAGEDKDPEISRDGRKLIYNTTRNLFTLTVLDPATQQKRELREVRMSMGAPEFSPTGDKIAFNMYIDEGDLHLFTIDVDGRNLTQVTKAEGERNGVARWSRDGSALYFHQDRPIASFRKISLRGGQSVEIVRGWTLGSQWLVHLDPQEKFIAHSQNENGIVIGTFLREIATGKETQFRKRMYEPRWSKDGEWILGTELNSGSAWFGDIVICSVSTGECRKIATRGNLPKWSHDDSRVYFSRPKGLWDRDLFSVSIDGTDERLVAELKPLPPYGQFWDVSPKGEIAYIPWKPGKPELWMLELK
jgi:serine/threonine protein kinase/Tol biopolymer transport system component